MDWIDSYMEYTAGLPTPELFRLWTGIATVAGALERRVFVQTARSPIYPNLFTLLVAPPAVGKSQAISVTEEFWYATKKLKIAPNNVTKASLVDALVSADRKLIFPGGILEQHPLVVAAGEFGVLVPSHDLEFLSVLNYIFDNPRNYREERRTLNKSIDIVNPQINLLAGTQPGFLASLLPEEAWSMGFCSRLIMVYSTTSPRVSLFGKSEDRSHLFRGMVKTLVEMTNLVGGFTFEKGAQDLLETWLQNGCQPVPEHSKLQHYNGRRILHALKLSMVAAVSRGQELLVTLPDVQRAINWLLAVEQVMPDIFRDMVGRSDSQIIQDLHFLMWRIYAKEKKSIHESRIIHFLQTQVPAEKVLRVMEIAERSGIIQRMAGTDSYIPKPANEHGVE